MGGALELVTIPFSHYCEKAPDGHAAPSMRKTPRRRPVDER